MSTLKVFSSGSPPDSMWLEPVGTWSDLITGRRSADGLFVRAEDTLRLINERAHEGNPLPCGSEDDESDFERRERIADEIGDRKHDQSRDNT